MNYTTAVMRETLRLAPSAPVRSVTPLEDSILGGGKYVVEKDIPITCGIYMIHRDPKVWGEDVSRPSTNVVRMTYICC